ncbi:calcium-dependent phosphotriesterase [Hypoxylon trugodes]|uniref:calcium-dependent phosphotriesterase n=1 Tax=Hypoxylon trugodes TaxID=326681 RepID=UPI00219CF164|nr:calcium-dependent phosphotriesterase [Hypoxylon trugodes]KAI1392935.1 calcium-dependent phosphotriesterase [Hypoxylon trugodes]
MVFNLAVSVLALAALLPGLYSSVQKVFVIYNNAPERLSSINNFKSYEIKFADTIRNCEDGLLVESQGLALLSCDVGRESYNTVMNIFLPGPVPGAEIYAYNYNDASLPDSKALKRFEILGYEPGVDFHTLGLAYDEKTSTLFVANHRTDGPTVELFKLDLVAFKAKHFRTIRHPLLHAPNAIALINNHELLITNDHYFKAGDYRILSMLETYLGLPLASVVHVDISSLLEDPAADVKAEIVARVPFANGIELFNETTVAVASTSGACVYFYSIMKPEQGSTSPPVLAYKSLVKLPYFVDNVQISKDGALYAAGHPHPPSLDKYSATRHECNSYTDITTADPSVQEKCKTTVGPSWVSRWTEEGGVEHLYTGIEYPTSATAAFDSKRKVGIVTGLYAKGILVWRE